METRLKASTRKTLVSQTSEQLFNKLKNEKLFGISKELAIEILEERKAKGKFDEDISNFKSENKKEKKQEDEKTSQKSESDEKVKNKEITVKSKKQSKSLQKFPDFKLKFKKGQDVTFTPFRETKKLSGVVISSYAYAPKKGEVREDVRIRVGDKVYVKKGSEVE